jgi:hypothetical protein
MCKVLLAFSFLLLGADCALAYVGPGAGITFVNQAMTLLAWVLAAFAAVLLWPAYALLRRIHRRKNGAGWRVVGDKVAKVAESHAVPPSDPPGGTGLYTDCT